MYLSKLFYYANFIKVPQRVCSYIKLLKHLAKIVSRMIWQFTLLAGYDIAWVNAPFLSIEDDNVLIVAEFIWENSILF